MTGVRSHPLGISTSLLLGLAVMSGAAPQAEGPDPRPPATVAERRSLIESANAAMEAQDWSSAAEAWGRLQAIDPNLPDAAYNRGVARYRAGDFTGAAESFQQAARLGDADLAARAMYNEGTARYAEALKTLEAGDTATPPAGTDAATADPLKDAIERVGRSLDHFRDAIDADPASLDARANAELAHRLLRRLQQVQEQQQQQQGDGDQQQQPQQGDGDQQQQPQQGDGDQQQQPQQGDGDQQQQDQQGDGDQQQQPQQGDGDQQQQDQPETQASDQEGDEKGEEKPSQGDDAPSTPQDASGAGASTDADAEESPSRMSRDAAERLLQSVRDKERQRRRAKAREAERGPRAPVERDW